MLVFSLSADIDRTKGDDLDDNGQNLQENIAVTKDRCRGWFGTGLLRRHPSGLGRRFLVGNTFGTFRRDAPVRLGFVRDLAHLTNVIVGKRIVPDANSRSGKQEDRAGAGQVIFQETTVGRCQHGTG
jgi:hypothetical protein